MALHPDIQKRAQDEIDAVVGTHRLPRFEDRASLPFVEALYREVMRWKPGIPLGVPHSTSAEDIYTGCFIPKGDSGSSNFPRGSKFTHYAGAIVVSNIWYTIFIATFAVHLMRCIKGHDTRRIYLFRTKSFQPRPVLHRRWEAERRRHRAGIRVRVPQLRRLRCLTLHLVSGGAYAWVAGMATPQSGPQSSLFWRHLTSRKGRTLLGTR